jgi:hypothetical protein
MTLFQWLALTALTAVLVLELVAGLRRPQFGFSRLFRCLVWLGAGVAIYDPELLQATASIVGITRGADLVFYVAVLAFVGVSFYFYARYVSLQAQLTELVRHVAIREARRGGAEDHD